MKIYAMYDHPLTTVCIFSRATPFTLLVALDKNMEANGELYWDDGETIGKSQVTS